MTPSERKLDHDKSVLEDKEKFTGDKVNRMSGEVDGERIATTREKQDKPAEK